MFYTEPVIGFRAWRANSVRPELHSSVAKEIVWPSEEALEARCIDFQFRSMSDDCLLVHDAPESQCTCGIHAWYELEETTRYAANSKTVIGAVIAWGKIVVHTSGMRAQYMKPIAFTDWLPSRAEDDYLKTIGAQLPNISRPKLLSAVEEQYGLPVMPAEELETYVENFGSPLGLSYLDE